jgi:hypothetical protein
VGIARYIISSSIASNVGTFIFRIKYILDCIRLGDGLDSTFCKIDCNVDRTRGEMEDEERQPQGLLHDALVGHGVEVEESKRRCVFRL